MKFTKSKIAMVSAGGAVALTAVVVGVVVFSTLSEKAELDESFMMAEGTFRRYAKSPITPSAAAEKAIKENSAELSAWSEAALADISAGDFAAQSGVNEAAFKQKMIDDARGFCKLPGKAGTEEGLPGTLVKADFGFGFAEYVREANLPPRESLARLQRQWSDISLFVGILASANVDEIVSINVSGKGQAAAVQVEPAAGSRARRGKKEEPEKPLCEEEKYMVEFTARPASLVKALNAFVTAKRFIVVERLEFARQNDIIASAVSSEQAKAGDEARPRRRESRRRGRASRRAEAQAEEIEVKEEKKKGAVTEPSTETPFTVKALLVTCDFGNPPSAAADAEKESAEEKEVQK